ncbi:alpha/beta hydrolase [Candidatus Puniceispirillum sp.]|nr:alpha/beta hydrolase [Candidatus Puniceispirillum sp.]
MGVKFEPLTGRYFTLKSGGNNYRIYMEEAGSGIPMLCRHTAGSDARQYRHILADPEITNRFRVIAFDLPWHGKSNPPKGFRDAEYKITVDGYKQIINDFCMALELKSPVVMGCSTGGRIACHLALENSNYFRAMIALESSDKLEPYYNLDWLHRPDIHGGEVQAAFVSSQVARTSPNEYRWETLWHYMQGGPGVFKSDLHFYWLDGDFDDRSEQIDTTACPIYLMSGEYDCSCTPERTMATAARIAGSKAIIMAEIEHFPMSENPLLFKSYLMPVRDTILKMET